MKHHNLAESFEHVEGTAQNMADIMDSGITGAFFRFKSIMQETAIEIGKLLEPYVVTLMEEIAELAIKFLELDEATQYQILGWIALIAVVGPLLIVAGSLIIALGMQWQQQLSSIVAFTCCTGNNFSLSYNCCCGSCCSFLGSIQSWHYAG